MSNIQLAEPVSLKKGVTCKETIDILKERKIHQIPILNESNGVRGIVTFNEIVSNLTLGKVDDEDPIEKIIMMKFPKIECSSTLGKLSRILDNEHFAIVLNKDKNDSFVGIARQIDLLDFIKNKRNC